ncbi:MAG: MurR/RpiR family transcriptional regulator [Lachnospira sp.]
MESVNDILTEIALKKSSLSRSQKKIADYILANPQECAFITASELGKKSRTSESTVVRFPVAIGLKGYPQLQKELGKILTDKLEKYEKIDITRDDYTANAVLANVMTMDRNKIEYTLNNVNSEAFEIAIDDILSAENVYIVGVRSCSFLADFLAYYLKIIRKGVIRVDNNTSELFEQMIHVGERDVVIGISFPRYSMRTLKAMEFANDRNAKIIAITDSKHSPMNMYSSCNLFAPSEMASVIDSLVAPLSLINALIVAMCIRENKQVVANLDELKLTVDNYNFDGNDEIDMLDEDVLKQLKDLSEK